VPPGRRLRSGDRIGGAVHRLPVDAPRAACNNTATDR